MNHKTDGSFKTHRRLEFSTIISIDFEMSSTFSIA